MKKSIVIGFALLAAPAFAQQPAPPSPTEQALIQKLSAEINENVSARAQIITMAAKIAELQKQIDAAKKPDDKPKDK